MAVVTRAIIAGTLALAAALALAACSSKSSGNPDAAAGSNDATTTVDGGTCIAAPPAESGDGTYYAADGTGNCSFDASPDDLMVAAMNAADYGDAVWCGACVDVSGPLGDVVVRIVDQCPGCSHGDLDLSESAFEKIALMSAGRVAITWHEVACDVTGNVAYELKPGSSQFYTPIQIRNARYPIATLEARDSTGTFQSIPRVDYNYFVPATGLGNGPFSLRATDQRGHVVEDDSIMLTAGSAVMGAAQFPACP